MGRANIEWDDQGDEYTAWDRIRDERRAERLKPQPNECESFGEYASRCFAGGINGQEKA